MLTVCLSMPWRLGAEAAFPFHDLAQTLVTQSPLAIELLFVAQADGRSLLQLRVDFAPTGADLSTRMLQRAFVALEGEAEFECRFLRADEARLEGRFRFLHVRPDVLALPSNKVFSIAVPFVDAGVAALQQASALRIDAAYRVRLRPRIPDQQGARSMIQALAELTERAPNGAVCGEARRTFDMLRSQGWSAVEEFGLTHPDVEAHRQVIETLVLDHLAARFSFVPTELWLLNWGSEVSHAPAGACRGPGYLGEILGRMTPNAPVRKRHASPTPPRPAASASSNGAPYAFVSYAHKDATFVQALLQRLQAEGVRCWYDAGIEPGAAWDETLEERIDKAHLFIACVSDVYQASRYCRRELKYADLVGKPIIPVSAAAWNWGEGLRMMFQELQVHRLDDPLALHRLRAKLACTAPQVLGLGTGE